MDRPFFGQNQINSKLLSNSILSFLRLSLRTPNAAMSSRFDRALAAYSIGFLDYPSAWKLWTSSFICLTPVLFVVEIPYLVRLGSVSLRLTSPPIACISNESKSYKNNSVHSNSLRVDEK